MWPYKVRNDPATARYGPGFIIFAKKKNNLYHSLCHQRVAGAGAEVSTILLHLRHRKIWNVWPLLETGRSSGHELRCVEGELFHERPTNAIVSACFPVPYISTYVKTTYINRIISTCTGTCTFTCTSMWYGDIRVNCTTQLIPVAL